MPSRTAQNGPGAAAAALQGSEEVAVAAAHVVAHGLAESGQPHAAAGAVEQFPPELAFQRLDRLGHAALGEVEPFGGAPEVLFLGQGKEDLDLAQFH